MHLTSSMSRSLSPASPIRVVSASFKTLGAGTLYSYGLRLVMAYVNLGGNPALSSTLGTPAALPTRSCSCWIVVLGPAGSSS